MGNNKNREGGCFQIPLSFILLIIGGGYWWLIPQGNLSKIAQLIPIPFKPAIGTPSLPILASPQAPPTSSTTTNKRTRSTAKPIPPAIATQTLPVKIASTPTPWDRKVIRGIYLSRYQITNNADEQTIRQRVRYYHDRGINTIIHGVWGNGCTMYNSEIMQQMLGAKSCPNQFQDRWLEWTIDEAHKQGMQVHAYFEKGIKIDKNSPIFERAIANKWLVPGVDRTYTKVDHYVLDVEVPEVANLFKNMLAEFVTKYPKVDAVQWDDYLGYHAELPGKVDRTASLTNFARQMITQMKAANPAVSFDLCHHNPYWAKRYFAADWEKWGVDRVFIQDYNEKNFNEELNYAVNYAGVAITDVQLARIPQLVANPKIKGILVFPLDGKPEETATRLQQIVNAKSGSKPASIATPVK
ncbi:MULTISPECIES: family 10 glycosylhydrolase [unclassified Chamaesiphon]|uniref:family 10 glycosylhydrolase n=1 Tax=unclassified Chamaesiphon TaxID=2620921 RepID=UPI00286CFD7C|nr:MULTISPECIES: family 10 glycosylhydrolase [unclassified Chamaesiphon]